jgi:hypothetical protein
MKLKHARLRQDVNARQIKLRILVPNSTETYYVYPVFVLFGTRSSCINASFTLSPGIFDKMERQSLKF